jgi:hypothetical protein
MTSPPDKAGESPKGFTITDRRIGAEESAAPPGQPAREPDAAPPAPADAAPGGRTDRTASAPLPPVEFATFVLSLGSSALMHLGEVERPGTGTTEKNLPMAKHSIDILSMLEGKTKGNLTGAEAQLLENLLFDLRLRYVEATRK